MRPNGTLDINLNNFENSCYISVRTGWSEVPRFLHPPWHHPGERVHRKRIPLTDPPSALLNHGFSGSEPLRPEPGDRFASSMTPLYYVPELLDLTSPSNSSAVVRATFGQVGVVSPTATTLEVYWRGTRGPTSDPAAKLGSRIGRPRWERHHYGMMPTSPAREPAPTAST